MSSSDIGSFSVAGLARFRGDATLRVDSATGQVRVSDPKNPLRRAIIWVRDTLGLRSKAAVETEKSEIRAAYNRFFKSVAEQLRYREQAPDLRATLVAQVAGNKPKPLSVRMVRQIMTNLEASAPRHADNVAGAGKAQETEADPERLAPRGADNTAPTGRRFASWPMVEQPAPRHADEVETDEMEMEWDHTAEYSDPDEVLEADFNLMIDELDPEFLEQERERKFGLQGQRPPGGGDDDPDPSTPDLPTTDQADPEPGRDEQDTAQPKSADTGPSMDPYQTVFIDDLDEDD